MVVEISSLIFFTKEILLIISIKTSSLLSGIEIVKLFISLVFVSANLVNYFVWKANNGIFWTHPRPLLRGDGFALLLYFNQSRLRARPLPGGAGVGC
jgi:hypothetical protein